MKYLIIGEEFRLTGDIQPFEVHEVIIYKDAKYFMPKKLKPSSSLEDEASNSKAKSNPSKKGDNQLLQLSNSWHPPPPKWIKVNIDASLLDSYRAGIGGVLRGHKGRFLLAFGFSCIHWDIGQLELLTIRSLNKIIQDWMFIARGIIIKGDNFNVMKALQSSASKWDGIEDVVGDFSFLKEFRNVLFLCSNRSCNKLANFCANLAIVEDFLWDDFSSNKIPPFISLLKEECDSLSITS
ncbi:hypothetical protein M5K25_020928 [Dendrobium thyrsiflorum]|uniref:RNase H type-1 domain-containing protein n=1 Tax=Dendrobium thyrsiflorum TaxID=117978 RepID=A0ABD0UB81_DENTH